MPHNLSFDTIVRYEDSEEGIAIPVSVSFGDPVANTFAKVDCGAQVCLFSRETAEGLGIDVETGLYKRLGSLTGIIESFGHEVTLNTFDISVHGIVYFARHRGLPRNILGRVGWLRLFRFGLEDYYNTLYLSKLGD